jgi:hypothetical protein
MSRGQLSLSVVEAVLGVVLVMAVAAGFTVVSAGPPASTPQLDTLAHDAATVLDSEPTADGRDSRLTALARSGESFAAVRPSARDRLARLLPADVLFRVRTPHGTFGYPQPPTATVGSATAPTRYGPVTIRVWYG